MTKTAQKIENLKKGFSSLLRFCSISNPSEVERAGIIQAFEFTYELTWRALKAVAEEQGIQTPSPRAAFKAAYQLGLITEERIWLDMLETRNLTSHVYREDLAEAIYKKIVSSYAPEFQRLITKL